MRPLLVVLVCALTIQAAGAGAWTLDHGRVQMASGTTASRASQRFDRNGSPSVKTTFNKLLIENWMEYGVTDADTVFVAPEYVMADMGGTKYQSASIEAGVRLLLLSRIGMLSLQTSAKSAGAFDMSTSAGGEAGRQIELRLLYGTSFKFFGRDGFLDFQAAQRWIERPRPNELDVDATGGFWLTQNNLALLQSFNLVSGGGAQAPYTFYRLHKVQASWVRRITQHWSLQTGYFYSFAGRNIVQEQGFVAQVWYKS